MDSNDFPSIRSWKRMARASWIPSYYDGSCVLHFTFVRKRGLAVSTLICSSVLFLALLGGVAAVRLAHHQGAANLLADLSPEQRTGVWASIKTPRPSLVLHRRPSQAFQYRRRYSASS